MNSQKTESVKKRQQPLQNHYKEKPEDAKITDRAITAGDNLDDPWHGHIKPGSVDHGVKWEFGVHRAVGGYHDAPNPGDILCAALAACLESTIRLIADRMDITLEKLKVEATGNVDVRGTLVVDRDVPVGFQSMQCKVDIQASDTTSKKELQKLLAYAEYSCVNLQTLKKGVEIETSMNF
ncbi:MAG: OsmC family peroxiredoxin [Bacteroidetes bacterium]|jgi:uncharacterized OsmC-like protein|nr:OsmC family peroxiredoxin [Bacteroidota bacterium]